MNIAIAVLLVASLLTVAIGSLVERQMSPHATMCMERNDRCSVNGRYKCCRGLHCRSSGMGGQRCVRSGGIGGGNGNCVSRGNRCSMMPGSRRCCMGRCRRSMNGRTTCR